METIEELAAKLNELCATGARDQLISKGLARGMIWEDGILPDDSPRFSNRLTNDLLNHGYLVLGCAIRLRILSRNETILDDAFRTAAESIEAAVRRGAIETDRGFHLTVAAAAFHLGHFAARSFSLLAEDEENLNLDSVEKLMVALMQRSLDDLQSLCLEWLSQEQNSDQGIAGSLETDDIFSTSDAAYVAICRVFHQAISNFDFALRSGASQFVKRAIKQLDLCIAASDELKHVPLWWASILARHLLDDLWERSLFEQIPDVPDDQPWQDLRRNFIELLTRRSVAEIDLWPSQILAANRITNESDSLVVALPTSSGKTRIAELCILKCLAGGRRVIYVTPLRALSAQVEGTLSRTFKPLGFSVSSVYGASGIGASDVDTMASTDIVVATPEKLDFSIRQDATVIDNVGLVVLDEGHMIGLSEREIRYEILVQRLLKRRDSPDRRIVCLSAIFTEGDAFNAFTDWIRRDEEGHAIRSEWRPTRQRPATLEWQTSGGRLEYRVQGETVFVPRFIEERAPLGRRKKSFPQNRAELLIAAVQRFRRDGHAVLIYSPIRRSVESVAEAFTKAVRQGYAESFLTESEADDIKPALRIGEEWLGINHVAMQALRLGIAVHHGQLPRPFLLEIEKLLRKRSLNVAISSPTLAQGVDLSFSVLIFNSLWRVGKLLPAKEFGNVIGRVGRAFVDLDGIYLLPVHEKSAGTRRKRLREFHKLVKDSYGRELESGLFMLISVCLWRLKERLGIEGKELNEYVLNQQTSIDKIACGDDEDAEQMEVILAELDAGILALVEDHDCDSNEVASMLDEALKSSLWHRRLAIRELEERKAQVSLLKGRSAHIWNRTTPSERKGFFAASIGTEAGLQIVAMGTELSQLLENSTMAIESQDTDALANGVIGLAEILFSIHPFEPSSLPSDWEDSTWKSIVDAWIRGATLYRVTDSAGIAFVQEALVYRLVWAIEAVRIVLASLEEDEDNAANDDQTFVAICVTYGVPSIAAARLLECGLESRLLAVRLAVELKLTFTTPAQMNVWIDENRKVEPVEFNENERESWRKFLAKTDRTYSTWHRSKTTYVLPGDHDFEVGQDVRMIPYGDGSAGVFTPEFEYVGDLPKENDVNMSFVGILSSQNDIETNSFAPLKVPAWIKEFMDLTDEKR